MAEVRAVQVPDIGDFKDVDVIEVLVSAGQTIAKDDPLITLETDKASMDIPSPAAGKVQELKIETGDKVSEGSLILLLEAEGGSLAPPTPGVETVGSESVASPAPAAHEPSEPPSPPVAPPHREPPVAPAPPVAKGFIMAHATPSVRRFARELGVDLTLVPGSGRKGRIVKEDVQAFVKQAMQALALGAPAAAAPATGMGIPPIPAVDFAQFGEIVVEPLKRIKKLSGAHLHRCWLNVPMVTHHDEADVTELEAFRNSLKAEAEKRGLKVTALAFLMKAVASGLRAFPAFNASLSPDGESLILKNYYNVGIAVDTPNGLVVPVFRAVDQKSIYELSAEMADISKRARDGKLKPQEMQGGCMSISSLGGIGGQAFTPLVNAPEVGILGVTRSQMRPVWDGKQFVPRLMMPLDLSYDHRVIDGAEAARFMVHLCRVLGDPRRLLLL